MSWMEYRTLWAGVSAAVILRLYPERSRDEKRTPIGLGAWSRHDPGFRYRRANPPQPSWGRCTAALPLPNPRTQLGPTTMRHVAVYLAMIIAAAAWAAPPAQAQKNEGTGVLAPRGIPLGAPPPKAAPPTPCKLPNPSGDTAIDKAICANASLLRKDRRIASLFDALKRAAEQAKVAQLDADQQAWLELAQAMQRGRHGGVPRPPLRWPPGRAREAHRRGETEARDRAAQVAAARQHGPHA